MNLFCFDSKTIHGTGSKHNIPARQRVQDLNLSGTYGEWNIETCIKKRAVAASTDLPWAL